MLKGFIVCLVTRIFRLTTLREDQVIAVQLLFDRLQACGYIHNFLLPLFEIGFQKAAPPQIKHDEVDFDETVFFHTVFHPFGPAASNIQQLFRATILQPNGETHISKIRNNTDQRYGVPVPIRRLVIAHHSAPNLKNLLFPRKLRADLGSPPSALLAELQPTPPIAITPTLLTTNPYNT